MKFTEWYEKHYEIAFREAEAKTNSPVAFDYHVQSAEIGYIEYCKLHGMPIIMDAY